MKYRNSIKILAAVQAFFKQDEFSNLNIPYYFLPSNIQESLYFVVLDKEKEWTIAEI